MESFVVFFMINIASPVYLFQQISSSLLILEMSLEGMQVEFIKSNLFQEGA